MNIFKNFGYVLEVARSEKDAVLLAKIAPSLALLGGPEEAMKLIEEALGLAEREKRGYVKEDSILSEIFSAMAQVGAITGVGELIDKALEFARNIDDERFKSGALCRIATSLAQIGQKREARKLINEALKIVDNSPAILNKIIAMSPIPPSLAQIGEVAEAERLLDKLLGMINRIDPGLYQDQKPIALSCILPSMAQVGAIKGDRELMDKALRMANDINERWFKYDALSAIAPSFARLGAAEHDRELMDKALRIARSSRQKELQARALSEILPYLVQVGVGEKSGLFSNRKTIESLLQRITKEKLPSGERDKVLKGVAFLADRDLISFVEENNLPRWIKESLIKGKNLISGYKSIPAGILKKLTPKLKGRVLV